MFCRDMAYGGMAVRICGAVILITFMFLNPAKSALNVEEKQRIIDAHNYFRIEIALGKVAGQPKASNMLATVWNDKASLKAETWAKECKFYHSSGAFRRFEPYRWVGQNSYQFGHAEYDLKTAVKEWYDEVALYDFANGCQDTWDKCAHYTQVVWHNSFGIGCGLAACNGKPLLFCDYAPGGNLGRKSGTKPYDSEGEPCTKCPMGHGYCMNGALCASHEACASNPSACKCLVERCENGGTLNSDCSCSCPVDYDGLRCEIPCANKLGWCVDTYKEGCDWDSMYNVLFIDGCRKYCGYCGRHATVDCTWNNWSDWSQCGVTCGNGRQSRRRTNNPQQNGGAPCSGADIDYQDCTNDPCPVHCSWDNWTDWGECTVTCGDGQKSRTRQKNPEQHGGAACDGHTIEHIDCNTNPCPVDCVWGEWTEWGDCSIQCGHGIAFRKRHVTTRESNGGTCNGESSEQKTCYLRKCPGFCEDKSVVYCQSWALAGECQNNPHYMLGNCPKSCGICGCSDLHGSCGEWKDSCASHSDYMSVMCRKSCDLCKDCEWYEWSEWTACTVTCGKGYRYRSRTRIFEDDKSCSGDSKEREDCLESECDTEVDCHDNDSNCSWWAFVGECVSNPYYMGKHCMKSCRIC